ncbi:hypothetical protein [Azospirillum picis]|uniref:Uncharacterized protein n=1 Tax=Azospirillum picis TaxID=488438 RepID=A0ABU0MSX7_9PROT|nr:hypothetical protein [Azospirillum picis]MBP2302812.1 hypothetical protein [Azospirillum picis]MDQ0536526.1 hypothetical protein [Azospirillum picis]
MALDDEMVAPRWGRYVMDARAVLMAVADPSRCMIRTVARAIHIDADEAGLAIGEAMRAASREVP